MAAVLTGLPIWRLGALLATAILATLPDTVLAAADESPRGVVSITFDDGYRSQYEHGLAMMREFDMAGTLFLATRIIDEATQQGGGWFITWDEVKAFPEAGWEIGSHSHGHLDLTGLDVESLGRDLDMAIERIEAGTGVAPVSFTPPFGTFTDETIAMVMQGHSFHLLSYGWNDDGNPMDTVSPRMIGRFTFTNDMTADVVQKQILQAVENGAWLVLAFHGFVENEPDRFQISTDMFREILAFLDMLRSEGRVEVTTVRDAMAIIADRRAD